MSKAATTGLSTSRRTDSSPGQQHQVIFNQGNLQPAIIPLGSFVANAGGHGHLNVGGIDFPYEDFNLPPAGQQARINVRLATGDCVGEADLAVLSTLIGKGGSGLMAVGSNRGNQSSGSPGSTFGWPVRRYGFLSASGLPGRFGSPCALLTALRARSCERRSAGSRPVPILG
jgi:hypothetical protein